MDSIYELKQRMALLERAHASAGMGHFVLDPKRMTIEFSSWVRDNIGLNDMPFPLDRLPEIVVEEAREEFNRNVAQILERKEDFSFETVVRTAKGTARVQRITGITAFEDERTREELIGFFGILQEITHEKNSREQLLAARDAAQAELDARANILAVVSHEIRTPLSGILGVIDQLKRERSAEERERALTLIEESSDVLLDTLDAILHQARIGGNSRNLNERRFRPLAVAQRVAELFRPLARRKGLRIEVSGLSGAEVLGDPSRLQQIISNFVSNGVKFTQSGEVSIAVVEPLEADGTWSFAIKDTGAGMDKSRISGLFEPFGESSTDSLGKVVGAGLGLSITRELVETMGGAIEVTSEVGRGSTFTVQVPLRDLPNDPILEVEHNTTGKAVLLIERATERVQVEAVLHTLGLELVELADDHDSDAKGSELNILVADNNQLAVISDETLHGFQIVIALASEGDEFFEDKARPDGANFDFGIVSNTQIATALPEVLEKMLNDAA